MMSIGGFVFVVGEFRMWLVIRSALPQHGRKPGVGVSLSGCHCFMDAQNLWIMILAAVVSICDDKRILVRLRFSF